MSDALDFMRALAEQKLTATDRAVAVLWWYGLENSSTARSAADIAKDLELAGFGQQNVSRLRTVLSSDRRTAKTRGGEFFIRATNRAALDALYLPLLASRPIERSNSVVPLEIVVGTRQYIERVVLQLNASYDNALYDCCAVMCRRLLETLIIETYEAHQRADELKSADGQFMMFSGLLGVVESDRGFNLGRNSMQGLKDFKKLGDLSAHNRRFNARRDDIDRVRDGLRVAVEELLTLSGLAK
jgi:hypothetical protein